MLFLIHAKPVPLQILLDSGSHQPQQAWPVVKEYGICSPATSEGSQVVSRKHSCFVEISRSHSPATASATLQKGSSFEQDRLFRQQPFKHSAPISPSPPFILRSPASPFIFPVNTSAAALPSPYCRSLSMPWLCPQPLCPRPCVSTPQTHTQLEHQAMRQGVPAG